ncbi:MAG: hypothetical protein RIQ84_1276, partial [Pseudomonadota bacterium]
GLFLWCAIESPVVDADAYLALASKKKFNNS